MCVHAINFLLFDNNYNEKFLTKHFCLSLKLLHTQQQATAYKSFVQLLSVVSLLAVNLWRGRLLDFGKEKTVRQKQRIIETEIKLKQWQKIGEKK